MPNPLPQTKDIKAMEAKNTLQSVAIRSHLNDFHFQDVSSKPRKGLAAAAAHAHQQKISSRLTQHTDYA
jgi:hypothetical protein